ncbi:MAG: nitroreductase family protein [Bacteroidales bacterium]|jgi:predicted oxidoreductase (fatty acid repression mutant protein)|nr:nitroreductase family protein [Bacteroidales bacterium]
MENLKKIIKDRRSYYQIAGKSPISDKEIKELIDFAVLHTPSPFNSQSTRIVLLLNEHHKRLWDIVKKELEGLISTEKFPATKEKIENCFEAGYGTVLFYEDQSVVKTLQNNYPTFRDNFPIWSEHASAMHQYAIWLLLEKAGFGASLQHYNPLIDEEISKSWKIDPSWKLIAQMPFGIPITEPNEKVFAPIQNRSIIFE